MLLLRLASGIATAMLLLLYSGSSHAQSLFVPDSAFNNYGYATRGNPNGNTPDQNMAGYKILPLSDGTALVAGIKYDSVVVWKFLANGAADPGFGTNGQANIYIPIAEQDAIEVADVAVQPDKKIVVLVSARRLPSGAASTIGSILLLRLYANGSKDLSMGTSGYVIHHPQSTYEYMPLSLAVDSTVSGDYSYYVSSSTAITGSWTAHSGWNISKYKYTGAIDPSFNGTGYLQGTGTTINSNVVSGLAMIHDLRVMPSGKLMAAGGHRGGDHAWFIMRLNPNGTFDNTYASNGRVYRQTTFDSPSNALSSSHIHKDGTVTFVSQEGYGTIAGKDSSILFAARHDANGSPVMSYGTNGELRYHYEGNLNRVTFDSTNRLMLAWYQIVPGSQELGFTRFSNLGVPDTSFGNGTGMVMSEPIPNDVFINRTLIRDVQYGTDNSKVFVLAHRSATVYALFRYRFVPRTVTPPQSVPSLKMAALIYPNPATDNIAVRLTGKGSISSYTVSNMLGQTVRSYSGMDVSELLIDVRALAAGQYVLQLTSADGGHLAQMIMKQ